MTQATTGIEPGSSADGKSAAGVIDCDVHSSVPSPAHLRALLPKRWRLHDETYGTRVRGGGWAARYTYPPFSHRGQRADLWEDGPPGSDVDLLRRQLLDEHNVSYAILNPADNIGNESNQNYAAARARALNEYQLENFVRHDDRLRLSMSVAFESADFAVAEIERIGSDPGVAAVLLVGGTLEPLGHRRYWPIYEIAEDLSLPLVVHVSQGGGNPNTGCGWAAYHMEYHVAYFQNYQGQVASLICDGVFERFPRLRFVFAEGGVSHMASFLQRLDYAWERAGDEIPYLTKKPSEYVADHLWFSTQPIEESEDPRHVVDMFEELGIENIVFASDYPHGDMDAPDRVFPAIMPAEHRSMILAKNARRLFSLDGDV